VREAAVMIYRRALEKDLLKGRSIDVMTAASVYAACRQCGAMRTLDELSEASGLDRKEIGRTYRFLARELRLNLMPTNPQDYIERFCTKLGVSDEVKQTALEILRRAEEQGLISGRGPTGVAAAAIYIAAIRCNERQIQREVADIADVTEVTVRTRYKELADRLHIYVDV
jgi:transcription initiation factor TFIIB